MGSQRKQKELSHFPPKASLASSLVKAGKKIYRESEKMFDSVDKKSRIHYFFILVLYQLQ